MENIEVEIKLKIEKRDYDNIISELNSRNIEWKEKEQKDIYFSPKDNNYFEKEVNDECLRIREEGNKTFLNYKHIIFGENELDIHIDEFETQISNIDQMKKIFNAINIEEILTVHKFRKKAYYDCFEIAIDYVKDLGYFIEIEVIDKKLDIREANKKLLEIIEKFGLDINKRDLNGYSNLMYEKIRNKNKE